MANRYWVGGTANWDATAGSKWSTTSGGSGGAAVPTASDDVFFDASSGTVTVTIATATATCRNLNFTGFTGTWAGSTASTISGSLTLGSGMTRTYTGTITFNSTSTGNTLTLNGKSIGTMTFNGVGGEWILQDTLTTTGILTLTAGTLDLNGQNVTAGASIQTTGTLTRVFDMAGSTINITSGNWTFAAVTNLTMITTGSSITSAGSFAGAGTYNNLTMGMGGTRSISCTGGSITNLTINAPSSGASLPLVVDSDLTITGTFTANGTSANRIWLKARTTETPYTITAAVVAISYIDFTDITGAGAGSWSGTSIGDGLGNSGITFTASTTRYWVATTGGNWNSTTSWSTSSGGASGASIPLPQDDVVFDSNSISGSPRTITVNRSLMGRNISFSGVPSGTRINTSSVISVGGHVFGDFTLLSGMATQTGTASSPLVFRKRGTTTIDFAGVTMNMGITLDMGSGSWTQGADLTMASDCRLTLDSGSYDANGYNVTCGMFSAVSSAGPKSLDMGSGTWTLAGSGTSILQVWSTSLSSLTPPTNPVQLTYSGSTGTRTISTVASGASVAIPVKITAGSDILAISGDLASIDFTGFSGSMGATSGLSSYGDVTFSATMSTTSGTSSYFFRGGSITTNGITITHPIIITSTGTVTLADSLTLSSSRSLTLQNGTLDTANQTISAGSFLSSGSSARTLTAGTSTFEVTGTGVVWNINATNITADLDSTTIKITDTSASAKTFTGGGQTYGTLWFTGAGTGSYAINGANTFAELKSDKSVAFAIGFLQSVAQTVGTWNITGSSGAVVTLQSQSAGPWQLVKTGGGIVSADYLDISRSVASPANTWFAGSNSTDSGNNGGWVFDPTPVYTGAVTDVAITTATGTGAVVDDEGETIVSRGVVFGTSSEAAPGDVAPAASGYPYYVSESGSYGEAPYSLALTISGGPLVGGTTYYARAFAQNASGYRYGEEVSFTTLMAPVDIADFFINSIKIID